MKRYYIGDIHGYIDPLNQLLNHIAKNEKLDDTKIFFLGDLVDRGPASKDIIELLINLQRDWGNICVHRGNHDAMFLSAIKQGKLAPRFQAWMIHGGVETLKSYNVDENHIQDIYRQHPEHVTFIENTSLYHQQGHFISVHAGINFSMPVDTQTEETFCWIRHPFLDYIDDTVPIVIHGHTIIGDMPIITENRISIDTGIYSSGRLTACVIDDDCNINFYQTTKNNIAPVKPALLDRGCGTIFNRQDLKIE